MVAKCCKDTINSTYSLVTKHFLEKIRAAVDDHGLLLKVIGAVHKSDKLYYALDLIKITKIAFERREDVESNILSGFRCMFNGNIFTNFSSDHLAAFGLRKVSSQECHVANTDKVSIAAFWGWGRW